jgi:hypothetical protein
LAGSGRSCDQIGQARQQRRNSSSRRLLGYGFVQSEKRGDLDDDFRSQELHCNGSEIGCYDVSPLWLLQGGLGLLLICGPTKAVTSSRNCRLSDKRPMHVLADVRPFHRLNGLSRRDTWAVHSQHVEHLQVGLGLNHRSQVRLLGASRIQHGKTSICLSLPTTPLMPA